MQKLTKHGKKIAIDIAGVGCILIGLILSPLPGPWTIPMYILGLSLLGQNYAWARKLMKYIEHNGSKIIPERYKKYTAHIAVVGFLFGGVLSAIIYFCFIR